MYFSPGAGRPFARSARFLWLSPSVSFSPPLAENNGQNASDCLYLATADGIVSVISLAACLEGIVRLTVNKLTALHIMREMRASGHVLPRAHVGLLPPDPEPHKRWTKTALQLDALRLSAPPDASHKLYVAVPAQSARLKATFASNTVYEAGLPDDSFADVGGGVCIPCPELLFVEMAGVMSPAAHVLLGYELCGTFVRDADDPRAGEVAFGVPPVTSARKIRAYMDECHQVVGVALAERHLAYVEDNAWSPMEAVLATMLALPVEELGYGLGPLKLNVRRNNAPELVARGSASSRVPDIELAGKPIGFNYDGKGHLDLDSVLLPRAKMPPMPRLRSVRNTLMTCAATESL